MRHAWMNSPSLALWGAVPATLALCYLISWQAVLLGLLLVGVLGLYLRAAAGVARLLWRR